MTVRHKGAPRRTLCISRSGHLLMLRARPGRYHEVRLKIAGLTAADCGAVEAQINGMLSVCGCSASGLAIGLTILLAGPFFALELWHGALGWPAVSIAIGCLAMVAMTGKLAAIGIARWRLRRLIGKLMTSVHLPTENHPSTRIRAFLGSKGLSSTTTASHS